jgi:hypothetical protein
VQFINGNFTANRGTVFYVDGISGRPTDSQRSSIEMQNGDLKLTGTTIQAHCDERWQGIVLAANAQIHTFGTGQSQRTHSIIRDAMAGVHNQPQNSHYYLTNTDFINNDGGVLDCPRTNVLAGEGVQSCVFKADPAAGGPLVSQGGLYSTAGIRFYDLAETLANNYYGDFGNAVFTNNTFDRLRVGIMGTAGKASILSSSFTNCWYAAAYSEGYPNSPEAVRAMLPTDPMLFQYNNIKIPANFPAGYTTTANTTAYGVKARLGHKLLDNTITLAPTQTGIASRRVGVALDYQGTVLNNTIGNLSVGLEALTGQWYIATSYDFEKNTFFNNLDGVSFLYPGYNIGYPSLSVTMRCNTFSSTLTGATGIWVKPNTVFPTALGSSANPNGNNFSGIADAKRRFVSDASSSFTYHRYASTQEEFSTTSPTNTGNVIYQSNGTTIAPAVANNTNQSGNGACGPSSATPGVYAARPSVTSQPPNQRLILTKPAIQLSPAYPNPASATVTFLFALPANSPDGQVILRNLMGQPVAVISIIGTAGEVSFSVQSLQNGFYTAVLEVEGRTVTTQKLTIQH